MPAVLVVVASMGCAGEGSSSHFDAGGFSGLNELPRRNYMCRPWSTEFMLDLNGAMRVSQAESSSTIEADFQISALILLQDPSFAR